MRRTLWVDQLCINQQDDEKKTVEVQIMADIYKQCTRCLIWLGDIPIGPHAGFTTADAESALSFLQSLADVPSRPMETIAETLAEGPDGEAARKTLGAMLLYENP